MAYDSIPSVESLEQEVHELDRRLNVAKALLMAAREYQQLKAGGAPVKPVAISTRSEVPINPKRVLRTGPMFQTENAASKLMENLNRPVTTGEVVHELIALGASLPENASNVVSARLSNSPKFLGRRGAGWWFADRPWPGDDQELLLESTENA